MLRNSPLLALNCPRQIRIISPPQLQSLSDGVSQLLDSFGTWQSKKQNITDLWQPKSKGEGGDSKGNSNEDSNQESSKDSEDPSTDSPFIKPQLQSCVLAAHSGEDMSEHFCSGDFDTLNIRSEKMKLQYRNLNNAYRDFGKMLDSKIKEVEGIMEKM